MLSELSALNLLPRQFPNTPRVLETQATELEARENPDETCGPNIGSCDAGRCCSLEGYCGVGADYCTSPDCQYEYGPGKPSPSSFTTNIGI